MRFGIWAAVHGNRGAYDDPEEPYDASWEHNRDLVLAAEALGYESVLIAQHTMNPYRSSLDQLEAWTASAALAALTNRIEIISAIKPGLYHPAVLAKMALGIELISRGRFAINLVNAWNKAEFLRAGLPFPEHDERYAYGREWIAIVDALMRGETVGTAGRHFSLEEYVLRPADPYRARPRIYLGGESEPARALAADHADTWFINGQPLADVARLVGDVAARPRRGTPLSFGLSAFVIARESEPLAAREHERLLTLAAAASPTRSTDTANLDPAAVMHQTMARTVSVGSNGGTAAGLVGSYEQVAARIASFHRAGIELFMLQFQPFEREMQRFAREVMPRARALVAAGSHHP